jgi:hypothetical protein
MSITLIRAQNIRQIKVNFIIPSQISIPTEFWAPLYGLIPGFFVPSIISYLNGRRQREDTLNSLDR